MLNFYLVLILMFAINAHAAEVSALRLSGYGTLGYVVDDRDDIALLRDLSYRPRGLQTINDRWLVDSRLAVQFDYQLSNYSQIVGQALWRDQITQDANEIINLAYWQFLLNPVFDLKIGRLGYEIFMTSDHRNLDYAYNWVRPPTEYYSWMSTYSLDGIELGMRHEDANGALWRLKTQIGISQPTLSVGDIDYQAKIRPIWATVLTYENDPWRLHLGISQLNIKNDAPAIIPLINNLEKVANENIPLISQEADNFKQQVSFAGSYNHFIAIGTAYDDGIWNGQFELGRTTSNHTIMPASEMYYLNIGRRIKNFTPYITLSRSHPVHKIIHSSNNWGSLGGLKNIALQVVNGIRMDQKSLALGLRWDYSSYIAVKLELATTLVEPSGYSILWHDHALINKQSHINMLSTSINFVF